MSDSKATITLNSSQKLQAILTYIGKLKAQQEVNQNLAQNLIAEPTYLQDMQHSNPNLIPMAINLPKTMKELE